ncbi:MAG: prepilin-type N-terminal cleavage/methylation domain-containing protein [Nitrospirota bacterium]
MRVFRKGREKFSGFTLIEIMIAVVIIGILVAIAIPTMRIYRLKAKQSEARTNLQAIYTSETAYKAEYNTYSPFLSVIGWQPQGTCFYEYTVGADYAGNSNPGGDPMNNDPPGADSLSFTAVAWYNMDEDPIVDTWEETTANVIVNTESDITKN